MRQRAQRRQRTKARSETLRLRSGSTLRVERLCSSRNGSKGREEKDTGLGAEKRTGRKPVPKLSSGQVTKSVKNGELRKNAKQAANMIVNRSGAAPPESHSEQA